MQNAVQRTALVSASWLLGTERDVPIDGLLCGQQNGGRVQRRNGRGVHRVDDLPEAVR